MDSPASLGYRKEKFIKNFVTCLGFKPLISFFAIGCSNFLAIDQKEKLIRNQKKNLTRLGFEPQTSCVAGGLSYHLAIDMSCERMFNKHHIRESGDSMKME